MKKFFLFLHIHYPVVDWAMIEAKNEEEAVDIFFRDFRNDFGNIFELSDATKKKILSEYTIQEKTFKSGLFLSSKDMRLKT